MICLPHQPAMKKESQRPMYDISNHTRVPTGTMNIFGKHIVGTEALSQNGQIYTLSSYVNQPHSCFLGFPAAFSPITEPLPHYRLVENPDIVMFYCISYNPHYATHDIHVYAKSMIYAYKQLVRCTNILDCGRVMFFVDERCIPVVYQYVKAAGLLDLLFPFNSNKMMHYAAYIPFFFNNTLMGTTPFRFYNDVDMWWINLENAPKFDFMEMVSKIKEMDCAFYANTTPKSLDEYMIDLFNRCKYPGDTHTEKLKEMMKDGELPTEYIRGVSGCQIGVKKDPIFLGHLENFYNKYGYYIRDDEAFWQTFLTKKDWIGIGKLTNLLGGGMGFSVPEREYHKEPQLAHVGTYMYEHFFNLPYAEEVYDHVNKEIA